MTFDISGASYRTGKQPSPRRRTLGYFTAAPWMIGIELKDETYSFLRRHDNPLHYHILAEDEYDERGDGGYDKGGVDH